MVFLPRGVEHSFAIESDQVRMLIFLAPAGLERWFKEFSVAASAMALPPAAEVPPSERQRMLEAGREYGIEFIVPKK